MTTVLCCSHKSQTSFGARQLICFSFLGAFFSGTFFTAFVSWLLLRKWICKPRLHVHKRWRLLLNGKSFCKSFSALACACPGYKHGICFDQWNVPTGARGNVLVWQIASYILQIWWKSPWNQVNGGPGLHCWCEMDFLAPSVGRNFI